MRDKMKEEFQENRIKITDSDGTVHLFDEMDRIELDNGNKYVAVAESEDSPGFTEEENEIFILKVYEEGENILLGEIEDKKEFDEVYEIFLERFESEQ